MRHVAAITFTLGNRPELPAADLEYVVGLLEKRRTGDTWDLATRLRRISRAETGYDVELSKREILILTDLLKESPPFPDNDALTQLRTQLEAATLPS